jgi:hypothetical protein
LSFTNPVNLTGTIDVNEGAVLSLTAANFADATLQQEGTATSTGTVTMTGSSGQFHLIGVQTSFSTFSTAVPVLIDGSSNKTYTGQWTHSVYSGLR